MSHIQKLQEGMGNLALITNNSNERRICFLLVKRTVNKSATMLPRIIFEFPKVQDVGFELEDSFLAVVFGDQVQL